MKREKDNEEMRKVGKYFKENGGWKENRNSKRVRKRKGRTKKRQRLWRETEKRERDKDSMRNTDIEKVKSK